MNEKVNEIMNYAEEMRELYKNIISGKVKETEYVAIVMKLVQEQKDDGAWSKLDNYRIESDCRVEYLYNPTYYACAILIVVDNKQGLKDIKGAKDALEKGLMFSTGRNLAGHSYTSIADRMRNMKLFEKAGIYVWFNKNPEAATDFRKMWGSLIEAIRCAIAENRVFADWNEDFSVELRNRIDTYDKYNDVEWLVLHTIFYNAHAITTMEISNSCGINVAKVKEAVRRLVQIELIKQDSRSTRVGHQVVDDRAFFYTNKDYRGLLEKMM